MVIIIKRNITWSRARERRRRRRRERERDSSAQQWKQEKSIWAAGLQRRRTAKLWTDGMNQVNSGASTYNIGSDRKILPYHRFNCYRHEHDDYDGDRDAFFTIGGHGTAVSEPLIHSSWRSCSRVRAALLYTQQL